MQLNESQYCYVGCANIVCARTYVCLFVCLNTGTPVIHIGFLDKFKFFTYMYVQSEGLTLVRFLYTEKYYNGVVVSPQYTIVHGNI